MLHPEPTEYLGTVAGVLIIAAVWLHIRRSLPPVEPPTRDTSSAFGIPYVFGALSCGLGVVPRADWRAPVWEIGPPVSDLILLTGIGLLLLGAVIHLALRLAGSPVDAQAERRIVGTALLSGLFVGSAQLLSTRGYNVELCLVGLGASVIIVALIVMTRALPWSP